jgi:hypothetical protein
MASTRAGSGNRLSRIAPARSNAIAPAASRGSARASGERTLRADQPTKSHPVLFPRFLGQGSGRQAGNGGIDGRGLLRVDVVEAPRDLLVVVSCNELLECPGVKPAAGEPEPVGNALAGVEELVRYRDSRLHGMSITSLPPEHSRHRLAWERGRPARTELDSRRGKRLCRRRECIQSGVESIQSHAEPIQDDAKRISRSVKSITHDVKSISSDSESIQGHSESIQTTWNAFLVQRNR